MVDGGRDVRERELGLGLGLGFFYFYFNNRSGEYLTKIIKPVACPKLEKKTK